ncbi:hypothetical protein Hanom_Chr08g00699471 [Helianthus anomalus]
MIATERIPSAYSFIPFHALIPCAHVPSCVAYVTRLGPAVPARAFVKAFLSQNRPLGCYAKDKATSK